MRTPTSRPRSIRPSPTCHCPRIPLVLATGTLWTRELSTSVLVVAKDPFRARTTAPWENPQLQAAVSGYLEKNTTRTRNPWVVLDARARITLKVCPGMLFTGKLDILWVNVGEGVLTTAYFLCVLLWLEHLMNQNECPITILSYYYSLYGRIALLNFLIVNSILVVPM